MHVCESVCMYMCMCVCTHVCVCCVCACVCKTSRSKVADRVTFERDIIRHVVSSS